MKLKAVCAQTGLSRKTIRLYEEKGLLVPQKETMNGREYRDYTEEDVRRLQMIALLRRAWFTMEEIKQMQEDPESIQDIFPQYCQWLRQQKRELDELIAVAEQVQLQDVENVGQLTERMAQAAAKLPLPQWDENPHFKYLDELEEVREMKKHDDFTGRASDTKAFRQTALVMDRDRINDQAITFGQIQELEHTPVQDDGPVKSTREEPRWMRWLSAISGWVMAIGIVCFGCQCLTYYLGIADYHAQGMSPFVVASLIMMFGGGAVYAALRALAAYQDRKRWIQLVREQEREKQQKRG